MTSNPPKQRLYFGYGSNLWKAQMQRRCPTSRYHGIARLSGYRWIINERGYANIVQTFDTTPSHTNEVWGLVFEMQPEDEDKLDISEAVPHAYTKEDVTVDFWPVLEGGKPNVNEEQQEVEVLVYIDRKRTVESVPKKEYIYRIHMGVSDATDEGMPEAYLDAVIRKFIPDMQGDSATEFDLWQNLYSSLPRSCKH